MRKVLRKVKSQWAVLGVMGATVVALGTMNIPQAVAAELNGVPVTETSLTTDTVFVKIVSTTAVDYDAIISRGTDGINTKPWGTEGFETIGYSADYLNAAVSVSQEQVADNGVTWALVSKNGQEIGWIAKGALTVQNYAKIVSETAVDYAAIISRGTDAINTAPWGAKGYQTIGSSAGYVGKTVDVTKEQVTDYGVTWALVSLNGKELGWIAKNALTVQNYAQITKETVVDYPAIISRGTDAINTAPWGARGYQTIGSSADYVGKTVDVTKEQVTDYGVTWALVSLDGKEIGWIAKNALSVQTYAQITKETAVDYPATISRGTDAINTAPWGARGYQTIGTSAEYVGKTVDVTKEQVTDYGVTWAQISLNGKMLGWIAKDALDSQKTYAKIVTETGVYYPATITRGTDAINTAPWGVRGYQTIGSSAGYVGKTVDVTKEQVTDYGVTWSQISMNGEVLGWIAKDALNIKQYEQDSSETYVEYPAIIRRGTDAINTAPWGTVGFQTIGSSATYIGKRVDVTREKVTDDGVTWALVYLDYMKLGWIAKDALEEGKYVQVLSSTEVAYDAIVTRGTDGINDQPWGTNGFVTLGTSADYLDSLVNVVREEVTDNGVTWVLMYKDAHPIGWVDKTALTVKVYEGDQINRVSLSEVQTMVDDISPYFETGISYDHAHIMITGDYMDIYDNYNNNYMWNDYDSSVNQLINAIDERGWDGIVTGYWNAFEIYIPINQ
ncbi:SH3-like domain-containing protein [Trichococcus shcherbakoviae]|uniref:GW domain-containing protein n=1 Tax=Trichococcus shcherbakoviae TaxID=2094020 RepID=A0A383TDY6_9LACT|nr:SH3-like domain-containing protein [Trichococcus shcherbakoviae]SYZ77899.1 Hypothetical protein TART1_0670 [Trichococcus shcherbakoviae]